MNNTKAYKKNIMNNQRQFFLERRD